MSADHTYRSVDHVDLLIEGTVITSAEQVIEDGLIAVADGVIVAIGAGDDVERSLGQATVGARRLGGDGDIVMPGMVDTHNHVAQALVRSMIAHELPMIHRLYLPAELAMELPEVATSTTLCAAQLIRSGVTTLAETTATPAHEETVVAALDAARIRASVCRGAGDQRGRHVSIYGQLTDCSSAEIRPGDAEHDLALTASFLDRLDPTGGERLKGGVLASHVMTCSDDYFRRAVELSTERGASLQVHLARDREEVEFCLAVHGRRPVEHLAELGALSPRLLAIHAVLCTDREIGLLGEAGASIAHSPIECQNLLSGVPRIRSFIERGVNVGLGCDNALNDGFEVMRAAWILHSALGGIPGYDPDHMPADMIFDLATRGGARALGWEHRIGTLEIGKEADLVVIGGDAPHLTPLQHPVVDLVRFGSRAEVRHVVVGGEILLDHGELTTIDEERILHDARAAGARLREHVLPRRYRPLAPGTVIE